MKVTVKSDVPIKKVDKNTLRCENPLLLTFSLTGVSQANISSPCFEWQKKEIESHESPDVLYFTLEPPIYREIRRELRKRKKEIEQKIKEKEHYGQMALDLGRPIKEKEAYDTEIRELKEELKEITNELEEITNKLEEITNEKIKIK